MTREMTSSEVISATSRIDHLSGRSSSHFSHFPLSTGLRSVGYCLPYSQIMLYREHLQEAFSRSRKNRGTEPLTRDRSPLRFRDGRRGFGGMHGSAGSKRAWRSFWASTHRAGGQGRGRLGYGAFSHPCRHRVSSRCAFPLPRSGRWPFHETTVGVDEALVCGFI